MSSRPSTTDSSGLDTAEGGMFVLLESARYLLLTSFKEDGMPVAVPVRAVVDGDRAYFGVRESSATSRRLRRTDWVQVVSCTALGMVSFGPRVNAIARLLAGEEAGRAAGRLAPHPPPLPPSWAWRDWARRVTGWQTAYYELRPDEAAKEPAVPPTVTARVVRTRPAPDERRLPHVPLRQPGRG